MKITKTLAFMLATLLVSGTATAATLQEKLSSGTIVMHIEVHGCDADAKKLCPGLESNSRKVFMCLAAYEDNLSQSCKLGIAEAAMTLEQGLLAIDYSIRSCQKDADTYCLDVEPGEGRIVGCLKQNESKLEKQCVTALKETGMWNMAE